MSTGTVIDGAREIGRQIETAHFAIKHESSGTTTGSETAFVLLGQGRGGVRPAGSESSHTLQGARMAAKGYVGGLRSLPPEVCRPEKKPAVKSRHRKSRQNIE